MLPKLHYGFPGFESGRRTIPLLHPPRRAEELNPKQIRLVRG